MQHCALIDLFLFNSQAVLVDKTLYISGQLGLDTQTGSLVPGGVEAETKKALDNMGHILEAAGISYKNGILVFIFVLFNDFLIVYLYYIQQWSRLLSYLQILVTSVRSMKFTANVSHEESIKVKIFF